MGEIGIEERVGGAVEAGQPLTVVGRQLQPGDAAPDFELDCLDESGLRTLRLADTKGFVRVLNVVNSIDTPVCDVQTKKLDWQLDGARLVTVSMDLPFAEARWAREAGVRHPVASSHRSEAFGRDYGVLIKEWRALQRSIFVIDGAGHVRYVEYVVDQDQEPDYNAVVDAVMDAIVTGETANCSSDGHCC
ncbi:MAG: thioredoxin-dependent peroxiredoxin [Actinomycetota bacterium]|nr:thioredoxin-dependent peroxiredoxin [Actinomycetota bacterium]